MSRLGQEFFQFGSILDNRHFPIGLEVTLREKNSIIRTEAHYGNSNGVLAGRKSGDVSLSNLASWHTAGNSAFKIA